MGLASKKIIASISIYTNIVPNALGVGSRLDGHAWIVITKDGTTTTYGLWPHYWPFNGFIDGSNIVVDGKEQRHSPDQYNQWASMTYGLNADEYGRTIDFIQNKIDGEEKWSKDYTCSTFAVDVWNQTGAPVLNDVDEIGLSTPTALYKSIQNYYEDN
jgi:hypothetical protein